MRRRNLLKSLTAAVAANGLAVRAGNAAESKTRRAPFIQASDGTNLFYRDWGTGPAAVFVAPWALNSNWWEYQMAYLAGHGLRCVGYDRRGHGRSEEPGHGYDFDTLAGDLAAVIEQLDLHDVTLIGHSMGAAEVVRYLSRYHAARVARAVLIATITPFSLKTPDNPDGVDKSKLEKGRMDLSRDRPHQIAVAAPAFFGASKNPVSPEMMDWWTRMIVDQCSLKVMLDLHRVFTETDFRPELPRIAVATLLIHGDSDTSTPIEVTSRKTARLIPGSRLVVYKNAAHGLPITHMDRLNADLLAFVNSSGSLGSKENRRSFGSSGVAN